MQAMVGDKPNPGCPSADFSNNFGPFHIIFGPSQAILEHQVLLRNPALLSFTTLSDKKKYKKVYFCNSIIFSELNIDFRSKHTLQIHTSGYSMKMLDYDFDTCNANGNTTLCICGKRCCYAIYCNMHPIISSVCKVYS